MLLKMPQPRLVAMIALATIVKERTSLSRSWFSDDTARLLGERLSLEYDRFRRGTAASQTAMDTNVTANAPSRIEISSGCTYRLLTGRSFCGNRSRRGYFNRNGATPNPLTRATPRDI